MPDSKDQGSQQQDPQGAPPPEPTQEQLETAFLDKLEARLDSWFDKKVKDYRGTSTSRMGRTTLPEIMANIIFGPEKK